MEKGSRDPGNEQERERVERFRFGPWVFNVNRAQTIVAEDVREVNDLPVAEWARFYGLEEPEPGRFSLLRPSRLDTNYAMTTDLDEPVIVATLETNDGERFPLLIDGVHRLYRAYSEGIPVLPTYVLDVGESLSITHFALSPIEPSGQRSLDARFHYLPILSVQRCMVNSSSLVLSHPGKQRETNVVPLCSASVSQTACKTAGLLEFSVQYLDTPTSFEVFLDLFSGQVELAGTNVVRATVFGHKPEQLNPSISFQIYGQPSGWYVQRPYLHVGFVNKPVAPESHDPVPAVRTD